MGVGEVGGGDCVEGNLNLVPRIDRSIPGVLDGGDGRGTKGVVRVGERVCRGWGGGNGPRK